MRPLQKSSKYRHIRILGIKETNAKLAANGQNSENTSLINTKEIMELLGTDALLYCQISQNSIINSREAMAMSISADILNMSQISFLANSNPITDDLSIQMQLYAKESENYIFSSIKKGAVRFKSNLEQAFDKYSYQMIGGL